MRFIGLDLAWSARNTTGAAAVEGDARRGRLAATALLLRDEEVIDFVLAHAGDGSALVAVDAPLFVPNPDGRRPAEEKIGAVFARYHAGAHPANRRRLAVNGVVRGEELVKRLKAHGFTHRAEVAAREPIRQVVEVYPHPAMVSIFGLERILGYKARPNRHHAQRLEEFRRYHAYLRSLGERDPALIGADGILDRDIAAMTRVRLKAHEDLLDGIMCAYIAQYLWRWGMARAEVFGSMERGYITSPVPRDRWRPAATEAASETNIPESGEPRE